MSQYSAPERVVSYVVLIEYQYKFPDWKISRYSFCSAFT